MHQREAPSVESLVSNDGQWIKSKVSVSLNLVSFISFHSEPFPILFLSHLLSLVY